MLKCRNFSNIHGFSTVCLHLYRISNESVILIDFTEFFFDLRLDRAVYVCRRRDKKRFSLSKKKKLADVHKNGIDITISTAAFDGKDAENNGGGAKGTATRRKWGVGCGVQFRTRALGAAGERKPIDRDRGRPRGTRAV